MSPAEMVARFNDKSRQLTWARHRVAVGEPISAPPTVLARRPAPASLPEGARDAVPERDRLSVVEAADALLSGTWELLGTARPDIADPDWFLDQLTGRRAPQDVLAFRIDHRDEMVTGNVKNVWELSRHHHLTVLASAYWLTGDERYAAAVDRQLRSWWRQNPPLSGIHWTSGIEVGIRLVSWAWIRRLLHDWPKVSDLFEGNPEALGQLWWHQRFLAAFRSHGSSANNHAVAEECGRLVAACAFPWFEETERWRRDSARLLARHLRQNTFASGINRELATDYHRFVTELGLVAAVEAEAARLDAGLWELLAGSLDAAAALLDCSGRPPRQGDGDEGRALVLDDPGTDPWALLLGAGAASVGRRGWWPHVDGGVFAMALGGLLGQPRRVPRRAATRPNVFGDAGLVLLRTPAGQTPEIWCRCDGGPHGFLSIAAHAHADALSLELRHEGVEILVDPGTYCYHGEPEWRSYFRSTLAHNTVEVARTNQSVEGGPFLWTRHAPTFLGEVRAESGLDVQSWAARHTGYLRSQEGVAHERRVDMEGAKGRLIVEDRLTGGNAEPIRLLWHLGPEVRADLKGAVAVLTWDHPRDGGRSAEMRLPESLGWTSHRGEQNPVLGWYSPRFGERVPTTVLVGTGPVTQNRELTTVVQFCEGEAVLEIEVGR